MFVGKQAWNPWAILAQIAVLQCVFYLALAAFVLLLVAPYVPHGPLEYILNWHHTRSGSFVAWLLCLCFVLAACAAAVGLRFVVMRAKRCWDYGSTIYIVHLAACCAWSGFPFGWMWWALQGTCLAVTILLGELLCVRLEMADIPLGGAGNRRRAAASQRPDLGSQLADMSETTSLASPKTQASLYSIRGAVAMQDAERAAL